MEKKSIENGIIVTMNPEREILKDGTIVIEGNKIVDIGKTEQMRKKHNTDIRINAKNKLIIPGLISLHFHSDNMSRGVGEHMGLEEWLEKIYYPMLRAMENEDVYYSAAIAYAEALLSGTTTANDMYIKLEACAEAAEEIGIRAILSSTIGDLVKDLESLEDNERAFKKKDGLSNGRIKIWFGNEWILISSEELIRKTRELADKYNTGIHIHLNEGKDEVEACLKKHGKRPTELAHELGLLGTDVIAAHCVWLSDAEKKIYAETGTNVAHCPVSNMKLGNGIAPVTELLKLGVNVGLGPDDAPCNNNVNMFETMKFASLAQKAKFLDASKMPSQKVFEMATINGAKALGMEDQIGSLEKGKKADIVLLDLRTPSLRPLFTGNHSNVYQHLVYVAPESAVETVIVDGKIIVEQKQLKTFNLDQLIDKHQTNAERLIEKRKDYI